MRRTFVTCAMACALCVAALAGCSGGSTTFTNFPGEASVEVNGLTSSAEGDLELGYTDIAIDAELTEGTLDIEVYDIVRTFNDGGPDDITPLDVIYEQAGVSTGDHLTFSDDDGDILIRVTSSDGATGKLAITEDAG